MAPAVIGGWMFQEKNSPERLEKMVKSSPINSSTQAVGKRMFRIIGLTCRTGCTASPPPRKYRRSDSRCIARRPSRSGRAERLQAAEDADQNDAESRRGEHRLDARQGQ